jgi:hypothetical protein
MTKLLEVTRGLADMGLAEAAKELKKLEPKNDFEKVLLEAGATALNNFGPRGLDILQDILKGHMENPQVEELMGKLPAAKASDLLAEMQLATAKQRRAGALLVYNLGEFVGGLGTGILRAIIQ